MPCYSSASFYLWVISMRVTVIDYGSGNLRSAVKAFEKAGADISGLTVTLTDKAEDVIKADRIVLPGQGAFADCMKGLSSLPGMLDALQESVMKKARPFFGICVGMQLLADEGHEHGNHKGLGWIGGVVEPLKIADPALKIPHMGWNNLRFSDSGVLGDAHPLLKNLGADPYVYFVHSYAFYLKDAVHTLASCDYSGLFTASVVKDNITGTQFHPEKSQKTGLQLIRNFLEWRP